MHSTSAIKQVNWVPGARRGEFVVLSAGSGGRVLLWTVDGAEAKLILSSGYALVPQQMPQSGAASKVGVIIWSNCFSKMKSDPS